MADVHTLWVLLSHFFVLSMMAVGSGVLALVPEIQRFVVENQNWMTAAEFATAFTIGQAAPGPNVLFVTLVGFHVGQWLGAILVTIVIVVPPAVLALLVARISEKQDVGPLGRAVRSGIAPIAVGMMMSSGVVLLRSTVIDWRGALVAALVMAIILRFQVNPIWLILSGAVLGMIGVL